MTDSKLVEDVRSSAHAAVEALEAALLKKALPADLEATFLADDLSLPQRLTLCAYAQLAARIDPTLTNLVEQFERHARIDGYARGLATHLVRAPLAPRFTPASLLTAPSSELVDAVTRSVNATLRRGPIRDRTVIEGIRHAVYEHPDDRMLLNALRAVPGASALVGKVFELFMPATIADLRASAIQVTPESIPSLYEIFDEACRVLEVSPRPELYVNSGGLNAYATGIETPIVVLSSSLASLLSREELLFVIGHELGHIKSGHVAYSVLAENIGTIAAVLGDLTMGIGSVVSNIGITPALMAWYRVSELSCDHAGLLACQDLSAATRALAKLSGFPPRFFDELSAREFAKQAESLEDVVASNLLARLSQLSQTLSSTHPHGVERARELFRWVREGEYEDIVLATAEERRELAAVIEKDPLQNTLLRRVASALGAWLAETAGAPQSETVRETRNLLRYAKRAPQSPVERLFKVDVSLERAASGGDVQCHVFALTLDSSGTPRKVALTLPEMLPWDQVPEAVREVILRKQRAEYELYRVSEGSTR